MSNHVANGPSEGAGKYFDLKYMPHVVGPLDRRQRVYKDILHVIGNTPLVKLNRLPKEEGIKCDMYVKCEYLNPGGSVKDRIAFHMVDDAEEKGILKPGKSVVIEPTSGNTGIGIALACAVKGYRCIIVLPEKMSDEKVNTLRALGAEIIRTPTDAPSESPLSNLGVAKRLLHEIPGAVVLDQYNNPNNPLSHYDGTAEEILWSLEDDVDMIVMGAGTGGTVSGVGHKVKERCPKCVIVGVDPQGSILAQPPELNKTDVTFYEVEGLGYDFIPRVLDRAVIDKWVKTDDKDALNIARRMIKEEGILCGGSSGSAMYGALQAAKSLEAGQKCVVVLPDSIRNYMTKFISEQWMEARLFKPLVKKPTVTWWEHVADEDIVQPVPSIPASTSTAEALSKLYQAKTPLLNVVDDKGSIVGIFTSDNARRRLADLDGQVSEPLDKYIVKKFYQVDLADHNTLGFVSRLLDISPYVVAVKSEIVQGIKSLKSGEAVVNDLMTEHLKQNGPVAESWLLALFNSLKLPKRSRRSKVVALSKPDSNNNNIKRPLGIITSDELLHNITKQKHSNGINHE